MSDVVSSLQFKFSILSKSQHRLAILLTTDLKTQNVLALLQVWRLLSFWPKFESFYGSMYSSNTMIESSTQAYDAFVGFWSGYLSLVGAFTVLKSNNLRYMTLWDFEIFSI
jgi:hypothetical protein